MKRHPPMQGFRRLADFPAEATTLLEQVEQKLQARSIRYRRAFHRGAGRLPASGEPANQPFFRILVYIRDLAIARDLLAQFVGEQLSSSPSRHAGETQASGAQGQGQRIGAVESIQ